MRQLAEENILLKMFYLKKTLLMKLAPNIGDQGYRNDKTCLEISYLLSI